MEQRLIEKATDLRNAASQEAATVGIVTNRPTACHPQSLPRPNLPVEPVPIRTRHSESELPCMVCAGPTAKTFASHEYWGKHRIFEATQVPAYKCRDCGFETMELDAVVEFLSEAVDRMLKTGDRATARILQ